MIPLPHWTLFLVGSYWTSSTNYLKWERERERERERACLDGMKIEWYHSIFMIHHPNWVGPMNEHLFGGVLSECFHDFYIQWIILQKYSSHGLKYLMVVEASTIVIRCSTYEHVKYYLKKIFPFFFTFSFPNIRSFVILRGGATCMSGGAKF